MPLMLPFQLRSSIRLRRCGIRTDVMSFGHGLVVEPGDREDREALAVPGVADGLGGGHLHRLLVHHQPALAVAERHRADDREPA